MKREIIELDDDDWKVLSPGVDHKLGKQTLSILPLSVDSISQLLSNADEITALMTKHDITDKNYMHPAHLVILSRFLLEKLPEHIAESAGISVETMKKLPLVPALALTGKVIKVNIDSSDDLVKNFKALADQFRTLKTKTSDLKKDGESEISATS